MNKTAIILKHELLKTLKNKTFIIITIALPLLLVLGIGIYRGVTSVYQPVTQEINLGYVDYSGKVVSYEEQARVRFTAYTDEADAKAALLNEDISEYFVIPDDYLETGLVSRYTMSHDIEPSDTVIIQLRRFLISNLLDDAVNSEISERVKTPAFINSVLLDKTGNISSSQDVISAVVVPIIFALLFMISIFFASGFLFQSVTEEKENRIIEILLSSVSSRQLLTGKILGLGIAGLIQITVWLLTVFIFAKIVPDIIPALSSLSIPPIFLVWGIVYFILGYLLFASLYAGVGSIGSTAKEAQSWSMIFILPAVLPYYFSYFIISQPEGVLSRVLTLFPLTSPMTAMMRIPTQTITAWEIALSLVLLIGSLVLAMWLAAKIFRVFLLMYGKRPAIRDIVRSIREA